MLRLLSRNLNYQNQARWFANVARRGLSQQTAESVSHDDDQCLAVKWRDGTEDKFPYLYLRENCRCTECFDSTLRMGRSYIVPKFIDINLTLQSADIKHDGEQLNVKWQDGHSSVYSLKFLTKLRYKKPGEGQPTGMLRKDTKIWGSEFSDERKLPTFDFEKLLKDDRELYNWLVNLATRTGIAKLENVSTKLNQLKLLGDRVGYLLETNYGQVSDLKAYKDDRASAIGYTPGDLHTHSDYTFCHTSPAIGMLHCIEQTETEGGVNHWVDAFHVAHLLHQEDPDAFNILVQTPIAMRNIAGLANIAAHRNIISLDHNGKICAVCYNDEFRDAHMPLPPEKMKLFYKAYYRFSELLDDKRTSFWYKLKPGEILSIDNHRVLHGRSAFLDSDTNIRLLQLAYFDRDSVHSKIRFLAEEQGIASPVD